MISSRPDKYIRTRHRDRSDRDLLRFYGTPYSILKYSQSHLMPFKGSCRHGAVSSTLWMDTTICVVPYNSELGSTVECLYDLTMSGASMLDIGRIILPLKTYHSDLWCLSLWYGTIRLWLLLTVSSNAEQQIQSLRNLHIVKASISERSHLSGHSDAHRLESSLNGLNSKICLLYYYCCCYLLDYIWKLDRLPEDWIVAGLLFPQGITLVGDWQGPLIKLLEHEITLPLDAETFYRCDRTD